MSQRAGVVAERLHATAYDPTGRLVARPPRVEIRWSDTLSDEQRAAQAGRYGLTAGQSDGAWWAYDLVDQSPDNIRALLADNSVVDTNRIDPVSATARPRGALDLVDDPALADSPASGLVGAQSCAAEGRVTVETMDRPDGEVRLVVETATGGLLFLSEPYYPEREAWVDATPVPIARVNLAFSAIAVPPGRHAVLLRYVPRAFHWGLLIGLLTASVWAILAARER